MIVELLTLGMILVIGGIAYISLAELHAALLTAFTDSMPAAFVNNYTEFNTVLVYWLPAFIVFVAIATFIVMSLRKHEGDLSNGY